MASCSRCRLDLIRFTKRVELPRFTMEISEEWHLPQSRYEADGSAQLGCGIAPPHTFVIVKANASKACGCRCDANNQMEVAS